MTESAFKKYLEKVLKHEGGYVFDPVDPGGETNFGITKRTAEIHGYAGSMQSIPAKVVEKIYKEGFWDGLKLDQVAQLVSGRAAGFLFDTAVNCGTKRAGLWFQQALNLLDRQGSTLQEDGLIGPKTLSAAARLDSPENLIACLKALRAEHYLKICRQNKSLKKFIRGWLRRLNEG